MKPTQPTDRVGSVRAPTLALCGEEDQLTPPDRARAMVGALPDARLVVIPDGPHAITWTHAAQVNQALLGFLRDL